MIVANLRARRGAREVLADVSFTTRAGELLAVIGPNGAGKTTLFECIAGVLPFDGGTITRDESLFYVPDGIRPWPDQTVHWTLALTARMFRTRIDDALLDALDLTRLARAKVNTLSKGEAKRLAVAIGLTVPRDIILLDEPFDGLDFRQTRRMIELLRATKRTLVLSIHQLTDAERAADRFLLLDNGRSIAHGMLAELGPLEEVFLARA